jgi:hypothetical protein
MAGPKASQVDIKDVALFLSRGYSGSDGQAAARRPKLLNQRTSCPLPGKFPVGMFNPAAAHPPVSKMLPVPLTVTLSTTIAKHEWPLLALFTAPLKVTLAWGR